MAAARWLEGRAGAALLAAAVALAFADSSIVMLGLPEIYGELEASIPGVSLVITAYNLVVAVAAFAVLPLVRRARPAPVAAAGLAVFLAASLACGLVDALEPLVALRAVQGLGGALLLAASLPLIGALAGSAASGRAIWGLAGTLGAVLGPAAGGLLTELFDWRAIFIAQAPVALAALAPLAAPRLRALGPEPAGPGGRAPLWPNVGLVFAFGALVGALFLAVLMIVTVWGLGPLPGALVVSVLPVAAVAVHPLVGRAGVGQGAAAGAVLLAAGLVALAFPPAVSAAWAAAALAVCGAGFGLLVPPLTAASVGGAAAGAVAGAVSVGARHVGLVAALAVIAPVLAVQLDDAGDRATLNATGVILDARLPLQQKVPVSLDLAQEFERTPRGAVPDLGRVFDEAGAADDDDVRGARDRLVGAIEEALTRGFRWGYLVAALFALLAVVPVALWSRERGRAPPRRPHPAVAALLVAAAALVAGGVAGGGADLGADSTADPCAPRARQGGGFDAAVQGVILDGLAGGACELGVTREQLVLSFAPDVGIDRVPTDPSTVERAVRAGLVRSIDDAEERGSLPGVVADLLRAMARRAPVEELIRGGGEVGDLAGRVRDLDAGDVLDALGGLLP
ncbi:MFS transporter [Miltoncostaea marina]|uniref:MFS transporter n=1 Tax=Miltoncostaea marina TaxID=2843215 RepID=UPI001C3D04B2|nr:MFS transporter [Miltoncostaea marina]